MKFNINLIYLQFFSGLLFLITAGAFYSTENSNLSPTFASIGFAFISIGFVLLGKHKRATEKCAKN